MKFIELTSHHVCQKSFQIESVLQGQASPLYTLADSASSLEGLGKDTVRIAVFKESYLLISEEWKLQNESIN